MGRRVLGVAMAVVIGALFAMLGCSEDPAPDRTPPGRIGDLQIVSTTDSSVTLAWTAVGDDGERGQARTYDLRYREGSLDEPTWDTATKVEGLAAPKPAGDAEVAIVTGLRPSGTTYAFALKVGDEASNWSPLSNTVMTLDTTPPAAVTDLTAASTTESSITLTWTAPGDDGNAGTAGSYDVRYSTSEITDSNWESATQAMNVPTPRAASASESCVVTGLQSNTTYYFALKTTDEVANASGLSNVTSGRTGGWGALGSGADDIVFTLISYGTDLIAGGDFTSAGDLPAGRIARWDGSSWGPFGAGMEGVWPRVSALAIHNSQLIAGGYFTGAGGVSAAHIARWNGAISSWEGLGAGTDSDVYALAEYGAGLVAGGDFFMAGDVLAWHIASWDGSAWNALGSGMNNGVSALAVYNGDLIAGGSFTVAGDVAAAHIARWDGASWSPVGAGMDGAVSALTVYNGDLIAAGWFTIAGGVAAAHIARWDGSSWRPLGVGIQGTSVNALTVYGGSLIVGGNFATAGGIDARGIARWDGVSWSPLGSGTDAEVTALTVHGGELIVGGVFSMAGDTHASHIARWR